jgi:hypothetical protein
MHLSTCPAVIRPGENRPIRPVRYLCPDQVVYYPQVTGAYSTNSSAKIEIESNIANYFRKYSYILISSEPLFASIWCVELQVYYLVPAYVGSRNLFVP